MPNFLLHGPTMRLCLDLACILSLWNTVSGLKGEVKKDKEMAILPTTVSGNESVKKEKYGSFLHAAESIFREKKMVKGVEILATTELPARSVDLSALNLTELVNGMLRRALKDSKQFFSVLSITSYSSFAFHKVSVAIYNISNPKTVDPAKFPTRYCYCLSNKTNDLSDFTALLVDIVGNSTSYLTEIFKSTSILSVSQTNESDCVFICVMVGKSGRNLSDFWEMVEKSPVINYTFTSGVSNALATTRGRARTSRPTTQSQQSLLRSYSARWSTQSVSALKTFPWTKTSTPSEKEVTENKQMFPELPVETIGTQSSAPTSGNMTRTPWVTNRYSQGPRVSMPMPLSVNDSTPGGPPWASLPSTSISTEDTQKLRNTENLLHLTGILTTPSRLAQPSIASGTLMPGTQTTNPTKAPAPRVPQTDGFPAEWPFTPEKEPAQVLAAHQVSKCPRPLPKEGAITDTPLPLTMKKLTPCLMELCRFFQQCLCAIQKRDFSTEAMSCCLPEKIRRLISLDDLVIDVLLSSRTDRRCF
ncbi:HERV-H LTR-associating protein 1 [Grammomys surdaster]|uniref:HERV-H LTR-associating protein 1 n=1 Tax=Grammomys surdaster TaxID=491861 RepID=UPI00109F8750|nr:HERV-H LTR-associating protein 1 [Grammomys surdaster]